MNIFAEIFSLKKIDDINVIKKELKNVKVEQYQPKNIQLKENDKD